MNAKTCLLCGKPLGRIRVGAGGDFCSREHRNQYRLRRSMDCLTEANKVSTLARRRENPKALFANAAPGIVNAAPRGFAEAPSVMRSATARPAAPQSPVAWNTGSRLPRSGIAQLSRSCAGSSAGPRAFGMQILAAGRRAGWRQRTNRETACRTTPAGRDRKLREVAPAARVGNAYRVSARAPFRPPEEGGAGRAFALAARTNRPAAGGFPAASRQARLFVSAPGSVAMPANSRLAYAAMGFAGSPDAPAPVEWVGLTLRKGLGREGRRS